MRLFSKASRGSAAPSPMTLPSRTLASPLASLAAAACCLLGQGVLLVGCAGTHSLSDPVVRIQTEGGAELGVSTDYGVIYLGRSAARGRVEVEAYYGDGASIETSTAVPVGGGVFTAPTTIRLPSVPISFAPTRAGETLIVVGRDGGRKWESEVRVIEDPRVSGLLVSMPGSLPDRPDQVGAGVFRQTAPHRREFVGLASGRITLDGQTYLAVVGPEQTWRLVTFRRNLLERKRWVYREDIL